MINSGLRMNTSPADDHRESLSFQVLAGYLKTRLMFETDTRKQEDNTESATSVFFNINRSAALRQEDDRFPMVKHAGHG